LPASPDTQPTLVEQSEQFGNGVFEVVPDSSFSGGRVAADQRIENVPVFPSDSMRIFVVLPTSGEYKLQF
jgi:hypothetical protein